MDAWLYETCTQCLQHMVDIVALFYQPVAHILPRIFDLLSNFIRSGSWQHPSFPVHLLALAEASAGSRPWYASAVHEDGVVADVAHARRCVHVRGHCFEQAVSEGLQEDSLPCRRPHQSLASVGVAALVRLVVAAGDRMSASVWVEAITTLHDCAADTRPVSCPTPAQHPQGAFAELSCWRSAGVLKLQA